MAKQKELSGMERPSIPAVEAAAEDYRGKRDTRMLALKPELEAKQKLLDLMKKHNLKDYRYEAENGDGEDTEFEIVRNSKETVKVKSAKDPETDDDAE